jgi:uncharacterized protein YkwD
MAAATLRTPRRTGLIATLVLAMVLTLVPQTAEVAHADAGMESAFVAAVNRERAASGLSALSVAGDLTSAARSHSQVMGNGTNLHHNPNLGSAVSGWKKVGENVGRGPSVDSIHAAFMASAGHKKNILDPEWTQIGMGVVVVDGRIWVTQVFRTPAGAPAPAPAPAPVPEPEPAPEPEPKAAPTPAPAPAAPAATPAPDSPASQPAAPESAPSPEPESAPEPEPEPREVVETPLQLDRITLTLARLEAAERSTTMADVLG